MPLMSRMGGTLLTLTTGSNRVTPTTRQGVAKAHWKAPRAIWRMIWGPKAIRVTQSARPDEKPRGAAIGGARSYKHTDMNAPLVSGRNANTGSRWRDSRSIWL